MFQIEKDSKDYLDQMQHPKSKINSLNIVKLFMAKLELVIFTERLNNERD